MSFLRGRSVEWPTGSAAGTNHRLVVLKADHSQSRSHASHEAYSLFMQSPISFADETFLVFFTHVVVQFVVPSGAFTTELAHRVNLDVEVFQSLWLSTGMDRWQVVRQPVWRIRCMFVGEHLLRPDTKFAVWAWFRPHPDSRERKHTYHIRFPCAPLTCNLRSPHPPAI
jgi:hypothetical protein